MTKKPKPEPDDKEQSERFIETAHKLKVDESGESFERALKVVTPEVTPARPSSKQSSS